MLTILCQQPFDLRLVDRDPPRAGPGDVLVRIRRVGLCGTDYHRYAGDPPVLAYPRVMGHELAGEVIEAPAGSIAIFESRVWHKTGFNRTTDQHRAGVFAWYTRPIYRTQENWFLSLRPEIRQFANEDALVLLGYRAEGLGLVNGASPA